MCIARLAGGCGSPVEVIEKGLERGRLSYVTNGRWQRRAVVRSLLSRLVLTDFANSAELPSQQKLES